MPKQQIEDKSPKAVKSPRISKSLRSLIQTMAHKGLPLREAAQREGLNYEAMVRAFNKPHARALYNQEVANIRSGAAVQAYNRMVDMSMNAKSETVRADATKWVAGVDGLSPLKRVEGKHTHDVRFGGFEVDVDTTIDVTPTDTATGESDD